MFENWPYTNFHDLNLDWIIGILKNYTAKIDALFDTGLYDHVDQVLAAHPDWTTTVTDGAITESKINPSFLPDIKNPYVTPQMYGAVADGSTDDTEAIINAIQDNPGATIFFPEGTYIISRTLSTSAIYNRSNSFILSPYAVIKASTAWDSNTYPYMITLGGAEAANNTREPGSTYGIMGGGAIDGNNRAGGVAIMSGRHTYISNITITNFINSGIYIAPGANNGSSDADITNVILIGTADVDNIGLNIAGSDNVVKNVRADSVRTGVYMTGTGNYLDSVHPLFIYNPSYYDTSIGFNIASNANNFTDCYADGFRIGFHFDDPAYTTMTDCTVFWYSNSMLENTAIECTNNFHANVKGLTVRFRETATTREVLKTGYDYGHGHITGYTSKYNLEPTESKYKYFIMDQPETYALSWNSDTWNTPEINTVIKSGNMVEVRFRAILKAVPEAGDLKTPILPISDSDVWGMFSWGTSTTRETGRSPFWVHGWGDGSIEFPDAEDNLADHIGTAVNMVFTYVARETPLRP